MLPSPVELGKQASLVLLVLHWEHPTKNPPPPKKQLKKGKQAVSTGAPEMRYFTASLASLRPFGLLQSAAGAWVLSAGLVGARDGAWLPTRCLMPMARPPALHPHHGPQGDPCALLPVVIVLIRDRFLLCLRSKAARINISVFPPNISSLICMVFLLWKGAICKTK